MCSAEEFLAFLTTETEESSLQPPVYGCGWFTDIAHLVAQVEAKLQQTKESKVFQWAHLQRRAEGRT